MFHAIMISAVLEERTILRLLERKKEPNIPKSLNKQKELEKWRSRREMNNFRWILIYK